MTSSSTHGRPSSRRNQGHAAARARCALAAAVLSFWFASPYHPASAQAVTPPARPDAKLNLGEIIEKAGQGVVLLTVETRGGVKIGFGSGFLIDGNGLVATNLHVVRNAGKVVAEFRDGSKSDVKGLRALDKQGDLAILELGKVPAHAVPLPLGGKSPPAQGDSVTAIGHPGGLNFSASNGIVGAVRKVPEGAAVKPDDQRSLIQSTAAVTGGSSGGPLLSDTGKVVGINTLVVEGKGIGFAVQVSHLLNILGEARKSIAQPLPGDPRSELYKPLDYFEPRVQAMTDEYLNARREYQRQLQEASVFQRAYIQANADPGPRYAERFLQIAERDRRTPTAFQALYMACLVDRNVGPATSLKRSLNLMLEDHIKEKWLGDAFPGISGKVHDSVPAFLRKVAELSRHRDVRAHACYYLASYLNTQPKHDEAEVLRLFKRCGDEFKDVRIELQSEDRSFEYALGDVVKPIIFAAENLSVGRKALDIEGKDVDGKSFKLSDFRGKVVVLDFFADWCPFCVKMYPEERELVQTMAGKPFVILGVNCDSQDTLQQIIADKKVTWRCWSDGKAGPISERWQLDSYPMTFVIDQDGVIRHKFTGLITPGVLKSTTTKMVESLAGAKPAAKDISKAH